MILDTNQINVIISFVGNLLIQPAASTGTFFSRRDASVGLTVIVSQVFDGGVEQ